MLGRSLASVPHHPNVLSVDCVGEVTRMAGQRAYMNARIPCFVLAFFQCHFIHDVAIANDDDNGDENLLRNDRHAAAAPLPAADIALACEMPRHGRVSWEEGRLFTRAPPLT